MDIKQFKNDFDIVLRDYLSQKTDLAKKLLNHERLNNFVDYIDNFIFSGGKRIRPYVLYLMYLGFGGRDKEAIMRFGIIFELLHTMALIHDDIIDESDKRHGVPTVHCFVKSVIGENNQRIAEGQAILLGDLLLSWVYEIWYQNHNFSTILLEQARTNVHEMIEEVILGQMIDVDMMLLTTVSKENLEKKNLYKSARYTFSRPMITGVILAGADDVQQKKVFALGEALGLAFQVRDDLKDILGDYDDKNVFSDVQEGQQTIFTQYVFENGKDNEKALLKSCMGRKLDSKEIEELQKMFADSGAIEYGKKLIKEYGSKSNDILNELMIVEPEYKGYISDLIKKISDLVM